MVFSLVSSANYSQGAECLPSEARGRQCVPSCLMFLLTAYTKPCANIVTDDLNEILYAGSNLYCALRECGAISDLTDPQDLPERVSYKGRTIFVRHKGVLSGFMGENPLIDSEIYYRLDDALLRVTASENNLIIVFGGISVGVHKCDSSFYIFDSHIFQLDPILI